MLALGSGFALAPLFDEILLSYTANVTATCDLVFLFMFQYV